MANAYRWDLKVAISLINGEIGELDFGRFRCSLVGRGRTIYESVLVDPESLLDDPKYRPLAKWPYSDTYIFLAAEIAYRSKQGVAANSELSSSFEGPNALGGNFIDKTNEGQVREKFPRLWEIANRRGYWKNK